MLFQRSVVNCLHTHARTHAHTHARTHAHTHTECMHECMCVHAHANVHVCVCACVHCTHTCRQAHTCTRAHTKARPSASVLAWSHLPALGHLCATQELEISAGKSSWGRVSIVTRRRLYHVHGECGHLKSHLDLHPLRETID